MTEEELMLTHILGVRRSDLLGREVVLTPVQEEQLKSYKDRRQRGEPLQYILGSWDFYGFEFQVDPRVLVPRPETEVMVERALSVLSGANILDLGTGSGNIAVTMAKLKPHVRITTVDRSAGALDIAQSNARAHGVDKRITFVHDDMMHYLGQATQLFDLIISNPPYIPTAQMSLLPVDVRQEPVQALDGGPDGMAFFRIIIKSSPRLLRAGGYLMMEFGDGQTDDVRRLVEASGMFKDIHIHADLAGRERFIAAVRC